jgi:Mn-dependent DtxR family transcriptional regulator
MSSAQCRALVRALIYERAGEVLTGSDGVKSTTITVLERRGLMDRDKERGGARLTDAGRAIAKSLKGEV